MRGFGAGGGGSYSSWSQSRQGANFVRFVLLPGGFGREVRPAPWAFLPARPGPGSEGPHHYDGAYRTTSEGPAEVPTATPIATAPEHLERVRYDAAGLVPAIVAEVGTNQVLMMGYMNAEALQRTLDTGRTWFWSRSRNEYWCKGETSGDRQWVREAYYDSDGDTLLFVVEQEGRGACHTGERTCFYRSFAAGAGGSDEGGAAAG